MAMPLLINLDQAIAPVMTSLGLDDLVSELLPITFHSRSLPHTMSSSWNPPCLGCGPYTAHCPPVPTISKRSATS